MKIYFVEILMTAGSAMDHFVKSYKALISLEHTTINSVANCENFSFTELTNI